MRQITFQNVLEASTIQEADLGARATTPDGRQWVYVEANEAISLGHIVTRTANTAVDTLSSSQNSASQNVFITEGSAGWTVGQFQNAYGLVDDGTGSGQFFKIKDNTADTLELYPEYALSTALDVSDSDVTIVRPHLAEKSAITTLNQVLIGVAQVAIANNSFGWVLERGVGIVINGATDPVANEQLTPGDDTEGQAITIANGETPDDISTVGRTLVVNANNDEGVMVDVNIW